MGGIYKVAVEIGPATMIYTKFYKDWFRYSKVDGGGDTHKQQGDLITYFHFFKIRKTG
jgi:hypothetical protein